MRISKVEPVTIASAPTVLLNSIFGFTIAYGIWNPTELQMSATITLANVSIAFFAALWARARVSPVVRDILLDEPIEVE